VVKSPLRYPGGKSRAVKELAAHMPASFSEYREPFVGGGSVFVYLRQKYPHMDMWINDINYDVFCFWACAQHNSQEMARNVLKIKDRCKDGRDLFYKLKNMDLSGISALDRAIRFFVLNRIGFSGTADTGGFSQASFDGRFTHSAIKRLSLLGEVLTKVKITNLDYKQVIDFEGADVFMFLDPPYLSTTKSLLYGKGGILHAMFNHHRFSRDIRHNMHKWMLTYDDCPEVREMF